jgi:hypothetical protein
MSSNALSRSRCPRHAGASRYRWPGPVGIPTSTLRAQRCSPCRSPGRAPAVCPRRSRAWRSPTPPPTVRPPSTTSCKVRRPLTRAIRRWRDSGRRRSPGTAAGWPTSRPARLAATGSARRCWYMSRARLRFPPGKSTGCCPPSPRGPAGQHADRASMRRRPESSRRTWRRSSVISRARTTIQSMSRRAAMFAISPGRTRTPPGWRTAGPGGNLPRRCRRTATPVTRPSTRPDPTAGPYS